MSRVDGEASWPRAIEAFETTDCKIHRNRASAEHHQQQLDAAMRANVMLNAGVSVGVAARESGLVVGDHYHDLDDLFVTTPMVISHWQCREEPGYMPVRFENGGMFVWGDAGSWSGPYGAHCNLGDVQRYWQETKRRAGLVGAPGGRR